MNQITNNLYIGDIHDAEPQNLEENNIDTVINLSGRTPEYQTAKNYNYIHIPLKDGEANYQMFKIAAEAVKNEYRQEILNQKNKNTLVHCAAGISRSTAVLAAGIGTFEEGQTSQEKLDNALNKIKKQRPIANPKHELKNHAERYINQKIIPPSQH